MKHVALLLAAAAPVAFASAPPAADAAATKPAKAKNPEPASLAKDRVAPEIAAVRTDVPMPERKAARGAKSAYDFSKLDVGQSLGILNKTAKQLGSVVSIANRRAMVQDKNADGTLKFEMTEVKDQAGAVIGQTATDKPVMIAGRKYFVVDTDPKADPDKATARVFREA